MYLSASELKQLDLLKEKSPQARFALMLELIDAQLEAMRAGIRYRNPDISNEELEKCLKKRIQEIYS
jgi:hypothetical protein